MNAIQKRYINAKAKYEFAEKQEKLFELDFMKKKNITNGDGSKAHRVYEIDDDELFNTVNKEYGAEVTGCGLWDKFLKANEEYKAAENALIIFALDIIPSSMGKLKEDLKRGVETNLKIKEQLIENILKLDTQTLTN